MCFADFFEIIKTLFILTVMTSDGYGKFIPTNFIILLFFRMCHGAYVFLNG
jgi:hypothetical protein